MNQSLSYTMQVVLACMKKDIKTALSERLFTVLGVFVPVNFLILMSLFVLAGSHAPTAVVMHDQGQYARLFYDSMEHANSFSLRQASAKEASDLFQAGQIVAIVTIPANFDQRVQQQQAVQIDVQVNNLNTDFTDDIRRAVPLAVTSFYSKAFPHLVPITASEHDLQAQDTDYIPYLSISILVLALTVAGVLQAGTGAAREWERETIKELLLSPASRAAIVIGKLLGALVMSLVSLLVVLLVLVLFMGIQPASWGEVGWVTLLCLIVFMAWGAFIGMLVKQRLAVIGLGIGTLVPLFFLSGAFGPLSLNTEIIQWIARFIPLYYAVVLQQHAFHGFTLNTLGLGGNALILCGYGVLFLLLSALVLRRSRVAH